MGIMGKHVLFCFLYVTDTVLAAFVIIRTLTHNPHEGYPPSLGWSPDIKSMVTHNPKDNQPTYPLRSPNIQMGRGVQELSLFRVR